MRELRHCPLDGDGETPEAERAALPAQHFSPAHPDRCQNLKAHTPQIAEWLAGGIDYQNGVLWRPGGLEAQPARWVDAVRIVAARSAWHEAESIRAAKSDD